MEMNEGASSTTGRPRRLMGCTQSIFDPASRFRFMQYVPHLEQAGWRVSHRPNIPSHHWQTTARLRQWRSLEKWAVKLLRKASRWRDILGSARHDVIFINRELLGEELWCEQEMIRHNPRVIFDFDDAIFLGASREKRIEWICRNAAWVTAGNERLAAFARKVTDRVTVIPSVVEVEKYERARHDSIRDPVRVGWLGSNLSIEQTLFHYLEMFSRLQERLGFEFVIASKPRPKLPVGAGLRWSYVEWSPAVEENISRHIDIGLMPLVDEEFQRNKCGMKIVQYMAGALPVVVSPLGVNREMIERSGAGFLANSESEWHEAIAALVRAPALRKDMGTRGRAYCESNYSLRVWLPTLLEILDRVASKSEGRDAKSRNR